MKKINKILLVVLIILIIICIVMGLMYIFNNNDTKKEEDIKTYYEYFDNQGRIQEKYLKNVRLLENYLSIKVNEDTIDSVLERIVNLSNVDIPEDILKSYKNDENDRIKLEAEQYDLEINSYLQQNYNVNNIEEYLEKNEEEYRYMIKEDLVYQKLVEDLNIEITENDVIEYFSDLIKAGNTIENIKDNYGEKLAYKYTMEYKIKKELLNR